MTLLCRKIRWFLCVIYRSPVAWGSIRSSWVFIKPKAIFVTVELQGKGFSTMSSRQVKEKKVT